MSRQCFDAIKVIHSRLSAAPGSVIQDARKLAKATVKLLPELVTALSKRSHVCRGKQPARDSLRVHFRKVV